MNRTFRSFPIQDFQKTKQQVLRWCHQSGTCVFLDSHHYDLPNRQIECLAAAGIHQMIRLDAEHALESLQNFIDEQQDWCFGHLGYDLKHETEQVINTKKNLVQFPDLFFFVPQVVIRLDAAALYIGSLHEDHENIFQTIISCIEAETVHNVSSVQFLESINKSDYLTQIERIKAHIARGDCYELNYCIEFFAENSTINPLHVYEQLAHISPNPFSAYYRIDDLYLICASPERYIAKRGDQLFSQPIKGTVKRDQHNPTADDLLKTSLLNSAKERSENVMVVDLVRNDLSRVCTAASVQVDELFGVYTFPHLHHMISTVSGRLREGVNFTDIIRASFPMGSMTGAPKKRVLELIDAYEPTARGIFSGALGYISPEGDFDFNVVIRSIAYNQSTQYLSYHVGSGITGYAEAEKEYAECLLKAEAIAGVLS